jgi:hypothetical protein
MTTSDLFTKAIIGPVFGSMFVFGHARADTLLNWNEFPPDTTLRVEWDFNSDTLGFIFFLNGERLKTLADGANYIHPATEAQMKRGVDSFNFATCTQMRSKYFLGSFGATPLQCPKRSLRWTKLRSHWNCLK